MAEDELNLDQLAEQMERDDLEGAEKLTPRDFAKLVGVVPQAIYYHIRKGRIESEVCLCGRRVIDVKASRKALSEAKKGRRTRGNLAVDRRSDEQRQQAGD